jgi:hypothetical protein
MRANLNKEFVVSFKRGFQHYIKGNWIRARIELESVEKIKGSADYPSRTILSFIQSKGYKAPNDWKGHRVLTEK